MHTDLSTFDEVSCILQQLDGVLQMSIEYLEDCPGIGPSVTGALYGVSSLAALAATIVGETHTALLQELCRARELEKGQ